MKTEKVEPMNIGIEEKARKEVSENLATLLADTYTLYLMTHNFHWNVTGPMFQTLHLAFEDQYNGLWKAVDQVAERIRALGFPAPGTSAEFSSLTSIQDRQGVPSADDMIRALVEGHEAVIHTARSVFPTAERAGDQVTMDLLTERLAAHEKTAWMLRSQLA